LNVAFSRARNTALQQIGELLILLYRKRNIQGGLKTGLFFISFYVDIEKRFIGLHQTVQFFICSKTSVLHSPHLNILCAMSV